MSNQAQYDLFSVATVFGKEFYGSRRMLSINLGAGTCTVTYQHPNGTPLALGSVTESGLYTLDFPNRDVTVTPAGGATVGVV